MAFNSFLVGLREASFHPPALPVDAATELPWVLLEKRAYVADRSNATTARSVSRCGNQIQITCCVASPPRISYLCVFCRPHDMIGEEPEVLATEGNLVLLRIVVGTKRGMRYESDFYIYRPGGHEGPSLTRLRRPPGDHIFNSNEVGLLLRCRRDGHDDGSSQDKSYMVAALCEYKPDPGRDRFVLYLYNSKHQTWTTTTVSVEEHQMQQYHEDGYFMHLNTKVIAMGGGGDDDTIGFVDLWRGILLCDLRRVQDDPILRYIPLPEEIRPDEPLTNDARLSRDIAVVGDRLRCVRRWFDWIEDAWMAAAWSRTTASLLEGGNWEMDYEVELSNVNLDDLQLELLHLPDEGVVEGGPVPPFADLNISQPTLSLQNGDASVCFMVKSDFHDDKAWVIAVDVMQNKLQGVVEFDAKRYAAVGFAYLHSRISEYLKIC